VQQVETNENMSPNTSVDSKNTWESGHCLFSNDLKNDSDIDSDAHSCLSEQRKIAAVVDSSTAIHAVIAETVIEKTDIEIDSGVTVASTSQGGQNAGSPMETDVCDEEGSVTRTEQKRGQRLKAAAKKTESPKIAEKSNVGPLTRAAIEEVHHKRAVAKKRKESKQTPPILDFANETIHTINLLMLTMLVHTSEDCLLCQPAANYRALRITALKEEQFITAMIKPNKDIMEEMYAFLYEVTPVKTEHTLPIYQTYKTSEGQTHLKIVENQFAAFPSDMSLKKMAAAFGLTRTYTTTSTDLISDIFSDLNHEKSNINHKIFYSEVTHGEEKRVIEASSLGKHTNYISERAAFQMQHKIRVGILGGLHRTALALHVMGNYIIQNSAPKISVGVLYDIVQTSPVTSNMALHLFTPKENQLSTLFLDMCKQYSEQVNERRQKAVNDTVHSQMWNLLTEKTTPTMQKNRYLPSTLFVSRTVSCISKKTVL